MTRMWNRSTSLGLGAALSGLFLAGTQATAQCTPQWQSTGLSPGTNNTVHAITTWDPDGVGPLQPRLIAGGSFTVAGDVECSNVAQWDGEAWRPFGSGLNNTVRSLTTWDPDGTGPLPSQLVAAGDFTLAGGASASRIARWDGTSWQPLGSGLNDDVHAVTSWDLDGSGPIPAQLVAGGTFTSAGGVAANRIARWDGATWQPLGTGANGTVDSLSTWDPDGAGPLPNDLVAGGSFTSAGGATGNGIARWDGTVWQGFGVGMNGAQLDVRALATWDPDADGPLPGHLVAGGLFTIAGGPAANRIAMWNGSAWQTLGTGMNDAVMSLTSWDPDGDGPLSANIVAGGYFTSAGGVAVNRISMWNGTAWLQPLGATGMNDGVLALSAWDPDGTGPHAAQLIAGGQFTFTASAGVTARYIAGWDGGVWKPFGTGLNDTVHALTTWDPDGLGPMHTQLVAGGYFTFAGGAIANRIARWDGTAWQTIGTGMGDGVLSLTTWDSDGTGPLPAQLVAGGAFISAGRSARHIANWDGSSWQPFGSGMATFSPKVHALTAWDPDGPGPLTTRLAAGGEFTSAGGVTARFIAQWEGTAWQPFGTGMNGPAPYVRSLSTWDPDGAGPLAEQLVAGGLFISAGGVGASRIARWDGTAFRPFRNGMNGAVYALTTWDPDGTGPLAEQLIAGGSFTVAGDARAYRVARWDGVAWRPLGMGMNGTVYSLATWDPDGVGPLGPQLIAGGAFTTAGGVAANRIARWDGTAWQTLGTGMDGTVYALASWDPDGDGPLYARLAAGGTFTKAGGVASSRFAIFGCSQEVICHADLDDGSGAGVPDQAVNIDDLLFFVAMFEAGDERVDLDNDGDTTEANPDGAVDISDLLFFLGRFEGGC